MPPVFEYLLKLSLSLGIVYLFYQLLLRRLTFYNCNRFYLLGYTALCFIIPLINITPALETNRWTADPIANIIPAWQIGAGIQALPAMEDSRPSLNYWMILLVLLAAGSLVMALVFVIRYFSFLRIRRQATLLSDGNLKVYQINKQIIPFSFGNAIFINHTLHNEDELREIIRHEFVHVRQKHSIDILWAEFLCMINWYNPFVWLLRKSIRQNLEFIADHQVVKSGLDKKQYQYMLLKVIGNNHFSIASQFNFSSLKKRIAMMNKVQTSKRQLLRLLLLIPAVAILLLAFRQKGIQSDTTTSKSGVGKGSSLSAATAGIAADRASGAAADTVPVNEKGYQISVMAHHGDPMVVVKDKDLKEVKRILLSEWKKNRGQYEELYGEVPPPPPPPKAPAAIDAVVPAIAPAPPAPPATFDVPAPPAAPEPAPGEPAPAVPPAPPAPPVIKMAPNVKSMRVTNGKATVILKNDTKETYDLNNAEQKARFEKKYGKLPDAPAAPATADDNTTYQPTPGEVDFIRRHAKIEKVSWSQVTSFNAIGTTPDLLKAGAKTGDVFIQLHFKNGNWDIYNIGNQKDVDRFKKNYGEKPPASPYPGC